MASATVPWPAWRVNPGSKSISVLREIRCTSRVILPSAQKEVARKPIVIGRIACRRDLRRGWQGQTRLPLPTPTGSRSLTDARQGQAGLVLATPGRTCPSPHLPATSRDTPQRALPSSARAAHDYARCPSRKEQSARSPRGGKGKLVCPCWITRGFDRSLIFIKDKPGLSLPPSLSSHDLLAGELCKSSPGIAAAPFWQPSSPAVSL